MFFFFVFKEISNGLDNLFFETIYPNLSRNNVSKSLTSFSILLVVAIIFIFYMLGGLSILAVNPVLSIVLSLLGPVAMGIALRIIFTYKSLSAPFTMATLFVVDSTSGVSTSSLIGVMIIDTALYIALGAYIYAVKVFCFF